MSQYQKGKTDQDSAHPGSPGQRAVKWVCVCVCVRVRLFLCLFKGLFRIFMCICVSPEHFDFVLLVLLGLVLFITERRDWPKRMSAK